MVYNDDALAVDDMAVKQVRVTWRDAALVDRSQGGHEHPA